MERKMSKKILSIICIVFITISSVMSSASMVYASDNTEKRNLDTDSIQGVLEDESIRYIQAMPRGMYLQTGFSQISKAGDGLITAGGATYGQRVVDNISISVEVQKMTGGKWKTYEMWSVDKKNDSVVMTSKNFEVEPGMYRVVCIHSANTDSSSSSTNALYIS